MRQLNPKAIYFFETFLSHAKYPYFPEISPYYDAFMPSVFILPNISEKSVAFFPYNFSLSR